MAKKTIFDRFELFFRMQGLALFRAKKRGFQNGQSAVSGQKEHVGLLQCILLCNRCWAFSVPRWRHQDLIGSIRGHFGVTLWSFWHCFAIIWGPLGVVLTPFWGLFWAPFRRFWTPFGLFAHFLPFLRSFCGVFFVIFCEVECNIKQNNAREGKSMQNCAKIQQNYAKLCRNMHLFSAINDVVAVSVLPGLWTISARPPTFRDRFF